MKKLEEYVRSIPDFPEPGIIFRDITSVLQDADGLTLAIDTMQDLIKDLEIDVVHDELAGDIVEDARDAADKTGQDEKTADEHENDAAQNRPRCACCAGNDRLDRRAAEDCAGNASERIDDGQMVEVKRDGTGCGA